MTRAEQFAASFAHRTTRAVQRGASGAVLDSLGSAIGAVDGFGESFIVAVQRFPR